MQTYRNERHGFEIDVPEHWSLPTGFLSRLFARDRNPALGCGPGEAFNFQIGPMLADAPLDDTERTFRRYAAVDAYTGLHFGRIAVQGEQHVWACYHTRDGRSIKKYLLVLHGYEYAITASCINPEAFEERQRVWDSIVATFRLLARGHTWESGKFSRPNGLTPSGTPRQGLQAETYEATHPEFIDVVRSRTLVGYSPKNETDGWYAEAFGAVQEGNYLEARTILYNCLRVDPDHVLAHKELAVVLRALGDTRGAVHHRHEVKRLTPTDQTNLHMLAKLLDELGRRAEALQNAEELFAMDPSDEKVQRLVATLRR